jgi:hypothetical protein
MLQVGITGVEEDIATNSRIISESLIRKDVEGYKHGLIWGTIRIYSEGLRKTTNVLSQDSRSPADIRR